MHVCGNRKTRGMGAGRKLKTIAGPSCGLISPTRSPTWVMSGKSLLLAHLMPRESSLRKCKMPFAT